MSGFHRSIDLTTQIAKAILLSKLFEKPKRISSVMKFRSPVIGKLYEYLSKKSMEAYEDSLLVSNVVLSKQHTRGRVLETYLTGKAPSPVSLVFAAKKIIFYLVKNLIGLGLSITVALLHSLSGQRFHVKEGEDYVILDTFFGVGHLLNKGEFKDVYFPGLSEYLTKRKIEYVYIPKGLGFSNPLQLFRIFRILKKARVPVLTEFQVLGLVDYLDVLRFIFLYPFSIMRFARKLGTTYEDKVLYSGLWNALDGVAFESHIRYLFAKRLVTEEFGRIKCISWYENLVVDKNFYRGLRTISGKAEIIGAQLFSRPYTLMNLFPDEQEVPFNVVPDNILVNGLGYRFESSQVRVGVGPSLRYKHLFSESPLSSERENILVVLPYWDNVIRDILKTIREVDWPRPVKIKFHPAMNWEKYKRMIPDNFCVTDEPIEKLFPHSFMVVGDCTGAIIEAASLGIPVINISKSDSFSHDYMPEIGKGVVWDQVEEVEEVKKLVVQFEKALDENPEQLKEEGVRLKSFCFSEPTDELIGRAFELG